MSIFDSLPPSEQARQLANPEGPVGLAIAEWLNDSNQESNAEVLAMLQVLPKCQVLEIGFGNGRTAPEVVRLASEVRYIGIDISETMVDAATQYNVALIEDGRARFHLASADHIPLPSESIDRVFSIGV